MTYDTVSCEIGLADLLPDHGAIMGGRPGPIQTRADFERYPWAEVPESYWRTADRHFAALTRRMPAGMKALGGVGYGVFEISEDLVGFERLAYMQADDPELFTDLYIKIGDLLVDVWAKVLAKYGETFAICRMGDDLGFKTSTLVARGRSASTCCPSTGGLSARSRQQASPSSGTRAAASFQLWTT